MELKGRDFEYYGTWYYAFKISASLSFGDYEPERVRLLHEITADHLKCYKDDPLTQAMSELLIRSTKRDEITPKEYVEIVSQYDLSPLDRALALIFNYARAAVVIRYDVFNPNAYRVEVMDDVKEGMVRHLNEAKEMVSKEELERAGEIEDIDFLYEFISDDLDEAFENRGSEKGLFG